MVHIPRMGQEVIVAFEEGDPDRPIIVGSVYNAEQMPPYDLPANMTQSGIKSRSSKGGSPANFNEIRFEDKKGSELIFVHAEKDQDRSRSRTTRPTGSATTAPRPSTTTRPPMSSTTGPRPSTTMRRSPSTVTAPRTWTRTRRSPFMATAPRSTWTRHEVGTIHGNHGGGGRDDDRRDTMAIVPMAVDKDQTDHDFGGSETENVMQDREHHHRRRPHREREPRTRAHGQRRADCHRSTRTTPSPWARRSRSPPPTRSRITTGSASIMMKKDGTITIKGKDITIEGSGEIVGKASKNMTLKGQKILQN